MFAGNEYLHAWLAYFVGFLFLFAVTWYITKNIRFMPLRYGLRVLVAVFFLVPWHSSEGSVYLSPAWLMMIFEGIFENKLERAGMPLLASLSATLVLVLIASIAYWYFTKGKSTAKPNQPATKRKEPSVMATRS